MDFLFLIIAGKKSVQNRDTHEGYIAREMSFAKKRSFSALRLIVITFATVFSCVVDFGHIIVVCNAQSQFQQSTEQYKTVISQQKQEHGILFKTVVTIVIAVDKADVLFNRGVLATTQSQKIRIWCLDLQPKAKRKKAAVESSKAKTKTYELVDETEDNKAMQLSDVFLWHDDVTDSQDWYHSSESIGNQLAKKNVRSVACDMPGYGRSEGVKKFAGSSDLARSSFMEQLFQKLEMVRPVVFAPGISMSYVVPLATVKPSALGGVATCEMRSGWAVEEGDKRRNTERALRYLKTTLERLPDKASEIPVKAFLKKEKQDKWVEKVQREFAGMFPLTDVIALEGRTHSTDAKNANDVSIGIIRLSALAMLSNGKASGLVRKAILAKKKTMPQVEEEEVVEEEVIKTTIPWTDEDGSATEERVGQYEHENDLVSDFDDSAASKPTSKQRSKWFELTELLNTHARTHTHARVYIYIYIYYTLSLIQFNQSTRSHY